MPTPQVPEHGSPSTELTLSFEADPVAIRVALNRLRGSPPLSDLSTDQLSMAELVLAEVLNNVAEHAYGETGGKVQVRLRRQANGVQFQIVDEGRPMPDGRLPDGRLPGGADVAVDDLPEGGFGWHVIRSLCSDLTYARIGGQNRLSFALSVVG